jgi:hypothetical protein
MQGQIDISKHPYGFGGGTVLSGSVSASTDGFWYYPVTNTIANVKIGNLSGNLNNVSFSAGAGVYGYIYQVTQSSGVAIIYSGSADIVPNPYAF